MTHSSDWIVGVCTNSLTSDTTISIDSEEAFPLFSMKVNNHYFLPLSFLPIVQCVKRLLGRIGVFLDYDNGAVSVSDVFGSSLPSAFSSPLIPFLCLNLHELSISQTIY